MIALETIIGRERIAALAGMAAVVGLCWFYLWSGAGTGMSALEMTSVALFPHRLAGGAGGMDPSLPTVILMWWTMMIAMMTPSAAPLVLLYRSVLRHYGIDGAKSSLSTLLLLCGYLTAWLAFSVCAALLQKTLQPTGLISAMTLWSKSATLSAIVLAAAGLYQFTPLKRACLAQCRAPARFLAEHRRVGIASGFVLGAHHGMYCVGCCWLLMTLLFVGGVMNLVWIAALSLFVFIEKLLVRGERVGQVLGLVLIGWAAVTLLVR
jgi:predicted metal-binding membrane protein